MTSKIVTFTLNITKPAEPKVTQVTLGQQPVDLASAQKTSSVMTQLMQKQFNLLKTKHQTHYEDLTSSERCTVTLKTIKAYNESRPQKPLTTRFEGQLCVEISNDNGVDIVQPLSKESCDKLDIDSLKPRASTSSKSHKRILSSVSANLKNGALSSNPSPYNGVDIVQPPSKGSCDKLNIDSLNSRVSNSSKSHKGALSSASGALKNEASSSNPSSYIENPSPNNESEEVLSYHPDDEPGVWIKLTDEEAKKATKRLQQVTYRPVKMTASEPTPNNESEERLYSSQELPWGPVCGTWMERTEGGKWKKMTDEESDKLDKQFEVKPNTIISVDGKRMKLTECGKWIEIKPNFICRFFAAIFTAIGDYFRSFCSLFSSDNDELHDESLTPQTESDHIEDPNRTNRVGTYQTSDAALAKPVHGIRPLSNGNNICFINGSFQPLMNIPGLVPELIKAHQAKIKKETVQIQGLQDQINANNLVHLTPNEDVRKLEKQRDVLQKSIQASKTLIAACEAYKDKEPIWLNALRGLDSAFRSGSQEDAHDLLVRIWDPVLEPLRNGVNAEGKRDIGCIPTDLHQSTLNVLGQFVPKFGEEKQLEHVSVCRGMELIDNKDVSKLPPNGLLKTVAVASSIPFAVPPLKPDEKIPLQTLVTNQLTMQPLQEKDGTSVYEHNGIKSDYEVTQKRIVIESVGNTPPEFLTLHLKRFDNDSNKIETRIELPADNKLTLIVDGKNVNYEIHAVEVHEGRNPRVGHYFSYIKKESGWVEANDDHIAPLKKLPASVEKDAYIIFLKRIS
ncbi:MAG TPA: hypothetical protein VFU89_05360 [Rhabdochlamydiaceae bacterium]|nr:hypothetical protein [Rhabdochlamydiaceae bacterium]